MNLFVVAPTQGPSLSSAIGDLGLSRQLVADASVLPSAVGEQDRVLDFVQRHPDALYRQCRDGHLTGSAFVVDPQRGQTLLIHHRKLDCWLQPGGHADGEGNLALVAVTEAEEETGITNLRVVLPAIDVDIHTIAARADDPLHLHLDLRFLVFTPPGAEASPNLMETKGATWFDLDAPELLDSRDLGRLAQAATSCLETGFGDLWGPGN